MTSSLTEIFLRRLFEAPNRGRAYDIRPHGEGRFTIEVLVDAERPHHWIDIEIPGVIRGRSVATLNEWLELELERPIEKDEVALDSRPGA